jgi:hypothetical protein
VRLSPRPRGARDGGRRPPSQRSARGCSPGAPARFYARRHAGTARAAFALTPAAPLAPGLRDLRRRCGGRADERKEADAAGPRASARGRAGRSLQRGAARPSSATSTASRARSSATPIRARRRWRGADTRTAGPFALGGTRSLGCVLVMASRQRPTRCGRSATLAAAGSGVSISSPGTAPRPQRSPGSDTASGSTRLPAPSPRTEGRRVALVGLSMGALLALLAAPAGFEPWRARALRAGAGAR